MTRHVFSLCYCQTKQMLRYCSATAWPWPLLRRGCDQIMSEQFLSTFSPAVQTLAQRLRELIKQTIPNCIEKVYPGWRLLGYRVLVDNKSHYFCFIAPLPDCVVLGFEYGVFISDPEGLLHGEGKQVRQLTVKSQKDIRPRKFAALIKEAAELAALPKRELARKQWAQEAVAAASHSSC